MQPMRYVIDGQHTAFAACEGRENGGQFPTVVFLWFI